MKNHTIKLKRHKYCSLKFRRIGIISYKRDPYYGWKHHNCFWKPGKDKFKSFILSYLSLWVVYWPTGYLSKQTNYQSTILVRTIHRTSRGFLCTFYDMRIFMKIHINISLIPASFLVVLMSPSILPWLRSVADGI